MDPVHFTPIDDFSSDEFQSLYLKGMTYTIRPGNTRLAEAVERWLAEGKVRLGTPETPRADAAKITGAGAVQ